MARRGFLLIGWIVAILEVAGVATANDIAEPQVRDGWRGVKVSDPLTARALRHALEEASRRLTAPDCWRLVVEFRDRHGRPLSEQLHSYGVDVREYLAWIQFHDGAASYCISGRLFYTTPGSRVIRACDLAVQRAGWGGFDHLAATVIHEMLHTLGLGENPPSSEEITARVRQRCWSRTSP